MYSLSAHVAKCGLALPPIMKETVPHPTPYVRHILWKRLYPFSIASLHRHGSDQNAELRRNARMGKWAVCFDTLIVRPCMSEEGNTNGTGPT